MHGNQPIQHMIYLYDYAGQPWKAQYWLRQVMDRMYTPGPDGYCGRRRQRTDFCLVCVLCFRFLSRLPGNRRICDGSSFIQKATLHFENGNSLVVNAPNNSKGEFLY